MDIKITHLHQNFGGAPVIRDMDFSVMSGERIAFLGPNGVGKTTLFRHMNLMITPAAGGVELDGAAISTLSVKEVRAMKRRIATIYQQHNLIPRFKVINNILAGRLGQWSTTRALFSLLIKSLDVDDVRDVLEKTGIADKMYWRTDRLSVGQQQWVAIARALYQNPDLLLADEPCASLDPRNAEKLIRLLVNWSKQHNTTVIASFHDVELALAYFPRIIGLKDGAVFFDLPAGQVTKQHLQDLYRDEKPREVEAKENVVIPACCITPIEI
ncbi:MAG: phosphonate ABC transporter ATP-binding protein [Mariprofundus sp.]|nr:phosphonate ABC transporter ATP-binding protein [Mariprofundus sp.]